MHTLHHLRSFVADKVNLPRLDLALDSLGQPTGDETIRVVVYGAATARQVLRLLLADPLAAEQEWEEQLLGHDTPAPLVIRVGPDRPQHALGSEAANLMTFTRGAEVKELRVPSPGLNDHRLEILLLRNDQPSDITAFEDDRLLTPMVHFPVTPVHKAVLIADGVLGITTRLGKFSYPSREILTAADLPGYAPAEASGVLPVPIDVKLADQGVAALRQSIDRAFEYEKLWFKSRLPMLLSWLKQGSAPTDDGATKEAVKVLVASVLEDAHGAIQRVEKQALDSRRQALPAPNRTANLNKDLEAWSEKAHAELQSELDRAFTSRRWKKLNWWKLFWRVDDVGVLSSEMLSQRFLPRAERNVIYLAGQVDGSGVWYPETSKAVYSVPAPPAIMGEKASSTSSAPPPLAPPAAARGTRWPTHITSTRNYLQSETIPALQALAQRLVLESAGFSGLTTSLGALMYLSSLGLSESGAVAALGIVWSLRRLQKKWETAREYWQSEVREEGRKAVRAVEISVGEAIDKAVRRRDNPLEDDGGNVLARELGEAKELVHKAKDVLKKLK